MRKLPMMLSALAAFAALSAPSEAKQRMRQPPMVQSQSERDSEDLASGFSGSGGGRRFRDDPGSVTIITRKMIDDMNARNLCEVLRYAPGVYVAGSCW